MAKVKLTVVESKCRGGYHRQGDEFIVEDLCPKMCHELWHMVYPNFYTLLNGGTLDYGNCKSKQFDVICPDQGRVKVHGEVVEE